MHSKNRLMASVLFVTIATATGSAGAQCVGDCGGDGEVAVDELVTIVNVVLGNAQVDTCTAGDANQDGQIMINEVLKAVHNALNGCPAVVNSYLSEAPNADLSAVCTGVNERPVAYTPGSGAEFVVRPLPLGFSSTYATRMDTSSGNDQLVTIVVVDANKFSLNGSYAVAGLGGQLTGGAWFTGGCTDSNGYVRIAGFGFRADISGSLQGTPFIVNFSLDLTVDPYLYSAVGINLPVATVGLSPTAFRVGDSFSVGAASWSSHFGLVVSSEGDQLDLCDELGLDCSATLSQSSATTRVVGIETVLVSAGTFRAVRVVTEYDTSVGLGTDTRWYAEDVGQVKFESTTTLSAEAGGFGTISGELVSYTRP